MKHIRGTKSGVHCFVMSTAQAVTNILLRAPQGEFRNEPFTNFADHEKAREMEEALRRVGDHLGHEYDLVVGGNRLRTKEKIRSANPARPEQVVGVHQKAGAEHVDEAMEAALKAFDTWQYVSVAERASLLLQAAARIRERKMEFCAWMVYEVGKNWAEADADVGETIDFLEFYAREALRLDAAEPPIQYPGEKNELLYIPLGVGAVIPPWNFPLAIMAGGWGGPRARWLGPVRPAAGPPLPRAPPRVARRAPAAATRRCGSASGSSAEAACRQPRCGHAR